ncbi:MAG TPA: hypothetical protein VF763_10745 [Candidatus Limnocylindrales bacterium]
MFWAVTFSAVPPLDPPEAAGLPDAAELPDASPEAAGLALAPALAAALAGADVGGAGAYVQPGLAELHAATARTAAATRAILGRRMWESILSAVVGHRWPAAEARPTGPAVGADRGHEWSLPGRRPAERWLTRSQL